MPALTMTLALLFAPVVAAQIQVPLAPTAIPQFVEPLPTLTNGGIPLVNTPETGPAYTLSMCEFQANVLPSGTPGVSTTWVWGYVVGETCPAKDTTVSHSYIGPVVVATRGSATTATYLNQLGTAATTNVLAYKNSTDQTLMWADPLGENNDDDANACAAEAMMGGPPQGTCASNYAGPIPAAPHLHGGEIPAAIDGGPDAWWTAPWDGNPGLYGHGYYSTNGVGDAALGKATYVYPNVQQAAPIWFHDHVLGATRLNVYAGIAGAYVITDPKLTLPAGLTATGLGTETIVPLVIQDRMFDTSGQLYFPAIGLNPEHPFWVPEFVGDVIAVNGKVWPFMEVKKKRYRFLVLNGSNARAYELSLGAQGPDIWVIGNDQGYLDTPVRIPSTKKLVVMPGERYDIIVDFAQAKVGSRLLLSNTANTPYPGGAPVDPLTTGRVMEFRVVAGAPATDASYDPKKSKAPLRAVANVRLTTPGKTTLAPGVTVHKTRTLTLNEFMGAGGPLEILVNNTRYLGEPTRPDFTQITTKWNVTSYSELPHEGETEIWEIVNISADAHPIHPHLVAFQILNRQALDVAGYVAAYDGSFTSGVYTPGDGPPLPYDCGIAGISKDRGVFVSSTPTCSFGGNPPVAPFLKGAPVPPLAAESGWKDTVIAYPGEVTRIVVRFAPTEPLASTPADSLWYPFNPNTGHGYVWHCHIIDHEDNEMMRPMSIQANPNPTIPARSTLIVPGQDGSPY
jgi:FtsP/CotA-like multicopper oxidase with cupredoxin domain